MPTFLPQLMGLGSYFLQSTLRKILTQLHTNRIDEDVDQFECQQETLNATPGDSEVMGGKESPTPADPEDLEPLRRILDSVNTSVTKQLLEANVRKLASSPAILIKRELEEDYQVSGDF